MVDSGERTGTERPLATLSARRYAVYAAELASNANKLWTRSSHDFLLQLPNIRAGLPLDHPLGAAADQDRQRASHMLMSQPGIDELSRLKKLLEELPTTTTTIVATQFSVLKPLETLVHGRLHHVCKDVAATSPLRQFHMQAAKYYMDLTEQHKRFSETYEAVTVLCTKHWEAAVRLFDAAKDHLVENTNVVTQGLVMAKAQLDERTQEELKTWADDVRGYEHAAAHWLSATVLFEKSAVRIVEWAQRRALPSSPPPPPATTGRWLSSWPSTSQNENMRERNMLQTILSVNPAPVVTRRPNRSAATGQSVQTQRQTPRGARSPNNPSQNNDVMTAWRKVKESLRRTEQLHERYVVAKESSSGTTSSSSSSSLTTNLAWSEHLIALTYRWTDAFLPFYYQWQLAVDQLSKAHNESLRAEAQQAAVLQPLKDRLALVRREQEQLRADLHSLQDMTPEHVSIALSVSDQAEQLRRKYQMELDRYERLQTATQKHKELFAAAKALAPHADRLLWLRQQEEALRHRRAVLDATYVADVRQKTLLFTTKVTEVNRQGLEDHLRRSSLLMMQASAAEQQLWDRFETQQTDVDVQPRPSWQTVKPALLQLEDAITKQFQRAEPATWTDVAHEVQTIVHLVVGATQKFESWTWWQRAALSRWSAGNFVTTAEKLLLSPALGTAAQVAKPSDSVQRTPFRAAAASFAPTSLRRPVA